MADSITAMGSSPIYFPLVPNWSRLPNMSFGIGRELTSFVGTANLLTSVTDLAPLNFELDFLTSIKEDEYNLIEFLHSVLGQAYRFWIEYPIKQFEQVGLTSSGATAVECEPNNFEKISQGNERCFWAMKNGDLIVRKIDGATYDTGTGIMTLTIDTALDRDIDVGDYWIFGRFLLCRLGEDNIKQTILNNQVSTWSMKFDELPDEYDDEEAS